MLQVEISSSLSEVEHIDVAIEIIISARMCSSGCGSVGELGNMKTTILSTRLDGVWWNVLVAGAVYCADSHMKKQWLLDALYIGCVLQLIPPRYSILLAYYAVAAASICHFSLLT